MNDTNSEILYPIGRRPGTYSETSKSILLMVPDLDTVNEDYLS